MIVQAIWLKQIDNVETVRLSSPGVLDPKVIPLGVASGAIVRLEN
jgi:hypothetical protein